MAAISSLVMSDVPSHRPHREETDTPTTPKPLRFSPRSAADQPADSSQILPANDAPQASRRDRKQPPVPDDTQNEAVTDDEHADAMEVDRPDTNERESDGEGEPADDDPASRKKKGQRFFCTGYPPCNLSFTRSEHLARHIRKHTGERPFQCHCNRRFSRLDNLRQHAQTVHVNEEIPTDSLAATGTRFQRQIRTDRVRQGPRPRSGTMSSTSSQGRGHSRNLSASSVGSTSSNYSTVTEAKRRPPPLLMANESSRPKLGLDPPMTPPSHYAVFAPHSPGGISTPTSATFSATPGSPAFGSSIGSPMSTASRPAGYYGERTPGRRLSVPSGPNPFQNQHPAPYGIPYHPSAPSSSNSSAQTSIYSSPTAANFNLGSGYHMSPSEDWRRRTWHPSTFTGTSVNYGRPATSGLTYSQTPDAPQPSFAQHATAALGQAPRLPGIESFDQVQHRPSTPPRRQQSPNHPEPMMFPPSAKPSSYPELDDNGQVTKPSSWSQQAIDEIQRIGILPGSQDARPMEMAPPPYSTAAAQHQQQIAHEALQMHSSAARGKRQAWYNGPVQALRPSPEDSSSSEGVPTPGTSAVEVNPVIVPTSGYIEPQHAMMPQEAQNQTCLAPSAPISSPFGARSAHHRSTSFGERSSNGGDMNRLEALVAVATSDEAATTAR